MYMPATIVSLSFKETNISHSENRKKRKYTKNNPPIIAEIPWSMRF